MVVKDKLKELGIVTNNTYPKKTFLYNDIAVVGLYERELKEDFYFFNEFDKTLYKIPVQDPHNFDVNIQGDKFFVPISACESLWTDEEYVELPDISYREMTVRQYACIQLLIPESGVDWLDILIKKKIVDSKPRIPNFPR